ncbi:Dihydroflavonol 4-reductase [Heracleum sosnowskyi]|uniref:Dihydroflavonol 4-reductase n=1 Tax=Heracleum sosnowskyi TaxID=360622 RepID=A0AAD8J7R8_9APIA|nr:Dihydroflavonol 4-reductase [Heracleum sosnowskyi]
MEEQRTVCVTGASGYIGSWLVKRLLERGFHVRATVRDPGNEKKVKSLLELPNSTTNLSLWKADLGEESSFDDAIQGCEGVFHVATPMELLYQEDPAENEEIESTTLNGILSVMRSCSKAKTVKRFIYTSTTSTIMLQSQPPLDEYTEDLWSDVDLCYEHKMYGWMYVVAKTTAEKAAWKYAEENGIDMVTVHPFVVLGHFITPNTSYSTDAATALYTKDEANMALVKKLHGLSAVHVDDVCNAHIYLFEHPQAKGRYICSSHIFNIFEMAHSLGPKYPDRNIPTEFEGLDKSQKIIPCSSKKLMGLGFEFVHKNKDVGDLCAETIESCRGKGNEKVENLLELPNANTNLSLWKADLAEESSYDEAVQGCEGVFHVATPMELLYQDDPAGVCIVNMYVLLVP